MAPLAALAVLQTVGSIGGAFGAFLGARGQKASLRYQAGIDNLNAEMADRAAERALEIGQKQKAKLTRQAGELKSQQRTALAANGVDIGTGSAAELLTSTDILKEQDIAEIEENALNSAWGYRSQAVQYRGQARIAKATAKGINPFYAGVTSLLNSSGSVAQSWYNAKMAA